MKLSDLSVQRPILACVINALLVSFGLFALASLPVREYPDIDPPVVSISTFYNGANSAVVESGITRVLEDAVAGIEGIKSISSSSRDGRSNITLEFTLDRDIDAAANDVRDRVSRALNDIPEEADPPEISKADADADPVMFLVLSQPGADRMALTDYAQRYLVDRLSVVTGVSSVFLSGNRDQALRIWLSPERLAARALTADDIETALRDQNVELPAGRIESSQREFNLRAARGLKSPEDFANMVIARGTDGYPVRLADVARVEVAPENPRNDYRVNGVEGLGIGVIKQSKANALEMALAMRAQVDLINAGFSDGKKLEVVFDSSRFIEASLDKVLRTLIECALLVVAVIWLFLGSLRATIIPALTVPIALVASFTFLYALGFSVNILTLLALVLAVGLVVDDTIVVVENIHRRMELGEPPLLAAYRGSREVGMAVIATTAVLIAVFAPISLLEGNIGRLFREFSLALAAAVFCSGITALTLAPALATTVLRHHKPGESHSPGRIERFFEALSRGYQRLLNPAIRRPLWAIPMTVALLVSSGWLYSRLPSELAPQEDRGQVFIQADGPEGASLPYMLQVMRNTEQVALPYVERHEAERAIVRTPRFGSGDEVNTGNVLLALAPWGERPSSHVIAQQLNEALKDVPDARLNALQRAAFGGRPGQPVQIALGGPDYDTLAAWRDRVFERVRRENPQLMRLDSDYKATKPQIALTVDLVKAADVGVSSSTVGRTLETFMGGRRVTKWQDRGEEYPVILQSEDDRRRSPEELDNLYVRSASGNLTPLSNLVSQKEGATSPSLNRYDRLRSITLTASLAPGYPLGQALDYLEQVIREELPAEVQIRYRGDSRELKESGAALYAAFAASLLVVFLVLAGQFESLAQPFVILTTVPLGIAGALLGLLTMDLSLNIYSQVGLIMLIGLATKNGILIVEFANQLRDAGKGFHEALLEASAIRLRPILMTSIATVAGALPLMLGTGAGSEARVAIGTVVFFGVSISTLLTLFITPAFYALFCRRLASPGARAAELERQASASGTAP